jgi:hypothetical protein
VLDFRLLAKWTKGAYLSAGDIWLALILDQKVRESPLPEYTRRGAKMFTDTDSELNQWLEMLRSHSLSDQSPSCGKISTAPGRRRSS